MVIDLFISSRCERVKWSKSSLDFRWNLTKPESNLLPRSVPKDVCVRAREYCFITWVPIWGVYIDYNNNGYHGFVSLRAFIWVPIWGVYCVRGWWYGYHWICLIESFSNEYQYEGSIVWGGDDMCTIGFVSLRAFKWVPIWGVYCVRGWWMILWICLMELNMCVWVWVGGWRSGGGGMNKTDRWRQSVEISASFSAPLDGSFSDLHNVRLCSCGWEGTSRSNQNIESISVCGYQRTHPTSCTDLHVHVHGYSITRTSNKT